MDSVYKHTIQEPDIYRKWENAGAFKPIGNGKPYTLLMPPPNANASLHAGHAMYTIDDITARFKRMQGYSTVWIPGMDHAGFETQFVYEKHLAKQGKSRMDFDRQTLYNDIFAFVKQNSGLIYDQFKRLGFSADWNRSVFTLDKSVTDTVFATFTKMHKEGLIYRDNYIVNYCVHCGTSLAELEVVHEERVDPLYYVKYKLNKADGYISVATVRPETIFADTHLAVNPTDKTNSPLAGKQVLNPLTGALMDILADEFVDPNFGTGIVKLTPMHDPADFAVAKKHGLPFIEAVDRMGRITHNGGELAGLKVKAAREASVAILQAKDLIDKIDESYLHSIIVCYKCKHDLEPLTIPNWFIKVKSLKAEIKKAVEADKVKFYPKKFKRHMLSWLDIMHDWPISRQIVWGIRIPVWYEVNPNKQTIWVNFIDNNNTNQQGWVSDFLDRGISIEDISARIQQVTVQAGETSVNYVLSEEKPNDGKLYLPETDTFDTWFSSGQWPLVTLNQDEYSTRFPTNFLGTLSDILKFWVSRMILFSLYIKGDVPFNNVYLWAMVADGKGVKMSKSKGNVINPLDLVDKYGADALRMALIYGIPAGSKVALSEDKVRGMRNFANKVWNASRYVYAQPIEGTPSTEVGDYLAALTIKALKHYEAFRYDKAAEVVYESFWHWFCDSVIEQHKQGKVHSCDLYTILQVHLKLLHPIMPFVTEAAWQEAQGKFGSHNLISASFSETK